MSYGHISSSLHSTTVITVFTWLILNHLCVLQEMLKCTVDLADLVGMYFVMSRIAGRGQLKFMVAGIGWATAELVMTR